jgi:DNA-binding MarR family transcriptional regulator
MTGIVDRLERAGLVGRRRNPKDRRSILVALSPKGQSYMGERSQEHRKSVDELFRALPKKDLETFWRMLERLQKSLEARRKPPAPAVLERLQQKKLLKG